MLLDNTLVHRKLGAHLQCRVEKYNECVILIAHVIRAQLFSGVLYHHHKLILQVPPDLKLQLQNETATSET